MTNPADLVEGGNGGFPNVKPWPADAIAEIYKLRTVLEMGVQLCESGGHGNGEKCPTCHFMREAQKVLGQ